MTRWQCVQNGGWLGFRDPASHHFLGYDKNEDLCCDARNQSVWENFCVRQRPDEGYLLLMIHYDNWTKIAWSELRPVGTTVEGGSGKLALVDEWQSDATAWRFIRV